MISVKELNNAFLVFNFIDIRVIRKVTAQTLVSILKEESEHQTHLYQNEAKKIWTVV